jgi:seryl-tRNA synthetase
MGDIATDNYKKSVAKILDIWGKEAERIGKELAAVNAEIDKLEALQNPGPDDKKKLEELKKKREQCHKKMESVAASLETNLNVIKLPPNIDEDELKNLPAWIKKIIKAKGIPLGKGIVITPDIEFDFKAKKLKKLGITIKW